MATTKKSELIYIDFAKPWWHVIWTQKWLLLLLVFEETITNIFETLIPLAITSLFSYQRYDYFIYFAVFWLSIIIFQDCVRKINSGIELRCIHSIHFNAHQRLLTIDPIYHAHKDSGAILSKIDRCARSYETLIDAVFIDILGYVVGIITALISLTQESVLLSFLLCSLLISISIINIKLARTFVIPRERKLIETDDRVKSLSQENLLQFNFIRSYFASNEINNQLKEADQAIIIQEARLWNANITLWTTIKIMYLMTVFILGIYLLYAVNWQNLTLLASISLMIMYIQGTYGIISLERPVRTFLRSITRIKDLYTFIPDFGKQTFPVLQEHEFTAKAIEKMGDIVLAAQNVSFWYSNHIHIFNHHSLYLQVPYRKKLKLYGIIGPSGIGKSTLLNLVGGQLNPKTGRVLINGVDIYAIDDIERRKLIALQGQTATSFRGTLKHNLLFGLPTEKTLYTDNELIVILARVGLWKLFKTKDGLETKIGESGLTLSGGQRQRLNFASLYLRARYYNPILILIDEPTSSLDEVSEQAITEMILELATSALTLVIAHRLKTIQDAVGILDFSLVHTSKELVFYDHDTLQNVSSYYKDLISGRIQ